MNRFPLLTVSLLVMLTPALHGADKEISALAARIDQCIAAAWGKNVQPAPVADDAEFFRRVHLDLAGRIPSVTEIRDFLDDDRPDKRRLWVDRLLQANPDDLSYRDAYVNHFANVWRAWLLDHATPQALFQQAGLEQWLRQRVQANLGYDQLVRELLTQEPGRINRGVDSRDATVAAFYQANEYRPENLAGSTARLFLGVTLECAQCHDHPFAKWSRNQFWEYAAFFTDLPQSAQQNRPGAPRPRGEIKITGTDKVVQAHFLDGKEPTWKDDGTRSTLAEWMTASDNPFFARAAVNRIWAYFFGAGLVQQLEETSEENSTDYTTLLDDLARAFIIHKYNMKFLMRVITASQTYQRTSAVSHPTQQNTRLLARMPLRGLSPEQLFDSLAVATELQYTPAVDQDVRFFGPPSPRAQFLAKFPTQEPKTDYQTSILQALYLMNSEVVTQQTSMPKNRTLAILADQRTSTARKLESLCLVVLSRKPRPEESERFIRYIDAGGPAGDPKKALADVFWVLLNSPEFLLNH